MANEIIDLVVMLVGHLGLMALWTANMFRDVPKQPKRAPLPIAKVVRR